MNTLKSMLFAALVALPVLAAEAQPAALLNLKVGQKIALVLDGNPTTGYSWQLANPIPADAAVDVSLTIAGAGEENCCGFPTPTTLTITAIRPGKQLVHVVYTRPWEKGKAPAKEKRFLVKVLPAQK